MEISWLEDLVALSKAMNFSRAAELRNVTQPAFSRRIRALEDWVGDPLVDRSSHRIRLTAAGDVMLETAADVLRGLDLGRRKARDAMSERSTLRFASTHVLSLTFFPKMLQTLDPAVSAVPTRLFADNMVACERMMADGQVDFLLCHHHPASPTQLGDRDFKWIRMGGDLLIPVGKRDRGGEPPFVLPGLPETPTPMLSFDDASGLGRIVASAYPDPIEGTQTVFTSHLAVALKAMALEGKGVTWTALSLVKEELKAGGPLARIGGQAFEVDVDIILLRPTQALSKDAEALWDTLVRHMTPDGQGL